MNTFLFIPLILVFVLLLIFAVKISKRSAYISNIVSKYPIQVSTLSGARVGYLDTNVKNKIHTIPFDVWADWDKKVEELISCSKSYPEVMSDYIVYYFPNVKEAPQYKNFKIFDPAVSRCKILIECMQYDDVLKLCQISREEWSTRKETKSKADAIILSNPDAIKEIRKKDPTIMDEDIIKHRKRIGQIQMRYNIASAFDAWVPTQKKFNSRVRDLRDEHAKNCGCYIYDIEFQKPLSSGRTSIDKVSIWQIFHNSISPYLKEYHSTLSFSMQDNIPEFKERRRYYNDFVYDRITPYIRAISSDKTVLVVFNNRTSYQWSIDTYNYHYRYLKSVLENENIPYSDMEDIQAIVNEFSYDIFFVFDFITVNTDLIFTSKMLIESFTIKIPNVVWYSMIKEYDEDEMKSLCEDAIKETEKKKEVEEKKVKEEFEKSSLLHSKDRGIDFIKNQILAVNKHPFFSYYAIPNTLIGEAANSSEVKAMWLSSPEKYLVESINKNNKKAGYISIRYSIDGGLTWNVLERKADYQNIDEVTLFTYELFKAMGVFEEFISKGHKAISYMNSHQYLALR